MFKIFNGTVNRTHFGAFYGIMVTHASQWNIEEGTDLIRFEVSVLDEKADSFRDQLCRLVPCVEFDKEPTAWEMLINFFTKKKGNACDQCC